MELYDELDEGTRTRFLTVLGVDVMKANEQTQRDILAAHTMDEVEEAQFHGFV